jgi:hypothetical protein
VLGGAKDGRAVEAASDGDPVPAVGCLPDVHSVPVVGWPSGVSISAEMSVTSRAARSVVRPRPPARSTEPSRHGILKSGERTGARASIPEASRPPRPPKSPASGRCGLPERGHHWHPGAVAGHVPRGTAIILDPAGPLYAAIGSGNLLGHARCSSAARTGQAVQKHHYWSHHGDGFTPLANTGLIP